MYTIQKLDPQRLREKRDHAARHPDGRTAELMGHIDSLEQELATARETYSKVITKLARIIVARIMWGNKKQDMIALSAYERAGERYSLLVEEREASFGLKLLIREPGNTTEVLFIDKTERLSNDLRSEQL